MSSVPTSVVIFAIAAIVVVILGSKAIDGFFHGHKDEEDSHRPKKRRPPKKSNRAKGRRSLSNSCERGQSADSAFDDEYDSDEESDENDSNGGTSGDGPLPFKQDGRMATNGFPARHNSEPIYMYSSSRNQLQRDASFVSNLENRRRHHKHGQAHLEEFSIEDDNGRNDRCLDHGCKNRVAKEAKKSPCCCCRHSHRHSSHSSGLNVINPTCPNSVCSSDSECELKTIHGP